MGRKSFCDSEGKSKMIDAESWEGSSTLDESFRLFSSDEFLRLIVLCSDCCRLDDTNVLR